ncbi:MAG: c-type cytochrome [Candidatus Sericytochromatia bacterium]
MDNKHQPSTMGHSFDGIEEYDNPLPRWWLYMLYSSIVFSIIYWVLYPSWFGEGYLKWSQKTQYEQEVELAKTLYPVKTVNIKDYFNKTESIEQGRQLFTQNCASCHGAQAQGLIGPNLTDNIWLYGGKPEEIVTTITNGVKKTGMPTWGPVLGSEKIAIVASYVYSLSHDLNGNLKPELAEAAKANASSDKIIKIADIIGKPEHIDKGREIFKQNCTSCHGPEAKGLVGPNLTDNTWIHGGKPEDIQNTITKGVAAKGMPTWGPILGNEKVADVATFIYSLSHK